MPNTYASSQPGWLTHLLARRSLGLSDPGELKLWQTARPSAHLAGPPMEGDTSRIGSDALVQRILDDAASRRPLMGEIDPGRFAQAEAFNSAAQQGASPLMPGALGGAALSTDDSSSALVQRILDDAASKRQPIGLFDFNEVGLTPIGSASAPQRGPFAIDALGGTSIVPPRSDALVQGFLNESKNNRYEIDGRKYPYDFLNHGVSADLRFRDILYGRGGQIGPDHGFVVVWDPETGREHAFQAYPTWNPLPVGTLDPTSEVYDPDSAGYGTEPAIASTYMTGLPASALMKRLEDYNAAVDKEDFTYVPSGPNSNTYATGAWREITGSIPRLPPNVNAPGYGRTLYLRR